MPEDGQTTPSAPYLPYDPSPDASFNFNTIEIWEKEPLEALYHYTSAMGALGILSSNSLRATSVAMLNDTGEFSHGAAFIASRWEQVKDDPAFNGWQDAMSEFLLYIAQTTVSVGNYYVCCASTEKNSLSQFQLYGSYVLHLDAAPFLRPRRVAEESQIKHTNRSEVSDLAAREQLFHWRRVRYSQRDQTHLADITIHRIYNVLEMFKGSADAEVDFASLQPTPLSMARDAYAEGACFMKHESFKDENEARYVVELEITDPAVHIRDGRYGLTPYVELVADCDANDANHKPTAMLTGAGLGPGNQVNDRRAARFGLKAVITRSDLDFEVEDVDYPLR
ncbi:hypothetical protein [Clavibacter sp. Sh2088]|uniref:hypothetical protein n=1 Tax=Clavibacter sp. Sh2088 TaxID=3397676 RepID=UPI0039E08FBF